MNETDINDVRTSTILKGYHFLNSKKVMYVKNY